MTRRDLLKITGQVALLAGSGALAGGCNSGAGGRRVTIRFWNGWTGPDGGRALSLVRAFNQANPDIDVRMQRIDWGTYYNKLFVAGIAGRAPELFILHTHVLRRFRDANFLRPLDDLMAQGNAVAGNLPFPVADLDANVWQSTFRDGLHYGLPVDVHPMGMYYNRRLLHDAGFDAPPTDAATFREVLRRVTAATKDRKGWGFTFAGPNETAYTFMQQFGGALFTPNYDRCLAHNEQNAQALRFCVDLIQKDKTAAPTDSTDPWVAFRQGRVGITIQGIYMLPDLQKQKDLDFAGAPVPQIGTQAAVHASSHNFCLKARMDDRHTEAAWRFARFYSDHSVDWAEAGQVPVRRSVRESERFQHSPTLAVQRQFAREIPYVRYQPQLPFIFEFQTEFNFMVERVLRGTLAPDAALANMETNVNRIIERRAREAVA